MYLKLNNSCKGICKIWGIQILLVVSPNPTSSSLNVASNGKQIKQIRILDKTGVIRKQYSYTSGITNVTINVSDLPADLYNIQAYDGTNWVATKFIKN